MLGLLAAVIEAVKSFDLRRLYDEQAPLLLRQAQRLVGDRIDAEDVVQDVFLIAHRKQETLANLDAPGPWLYGVMRNVLRHHRRRVAKQVRTAEEQLADSTSAPDAPTPEVSADAAERRRRLYACLATLPAQQAHILSLFELEGLSGAEVGERLGKSENAVYVSLTRARKNFEQAWAMQPSPASTTRTAHG